jgi:nucleoside phosphorylase
MKVLVTFALENEFAPWKAMHDFTPGRWGERDAHLARIGGVLLGVLLTGAGPAHAGAATSAVFSREDAETLCISAGLAGALKPSYRVGEVLAARSVISEASGEGALSSPELVSLAKDCGATIVENFLTAGAAVATAESKASLSARADAVEMESFEILNRAAAMGFSRVAIRAVSDTCDEDLPLDMNRVFAEDGQVSVPRVLGQVARHPAAIAGLIRLAQNSKKAAESLARFLDSYIAAIAHTSNVSEAKSAALAL